MSRLKSLQFRAFALALAACVSGWSSAGFAQMIEPPASTRPAPAPLSPSDSVRLSDEERSAILDNNTAESAAAARGELTGSARAGRGIHGEVGAMIGSNGMRGAYGTAAIPLGDNAGAVVSFESSHFGSYRR
jgi:hypothetical protein